MDDMFSLLGRSHRKYPKMKNSHYYYVDLFNDVIDLQRTELESRFSENDTKLLLFMACLNPNTSFAAFDKNKLIQLARLYSNDFSDADLEILDDQLETYILDMLSLSDFSNLNGIGDLAMKMVETKRDKVYLLVYLLIKLAITLSVSTTTIEISFSAMKIVKNRMHNKIGDQWLNDNLVACIEKDVLEAVSNQDIVGMFDKMKHRRRA